MKIKLHNSLCKIENEKCFLFDQKVSMFILDNKLRIRFHVNDFAFFLFFDLYYKQLKPCSGFGESKKQKPKWWKDFGWKWKEMSK